MFSDRNFTTFLDIFFKFGLIVNILKICFEVKSTYIASMFFCFWGDNEEEWYLFMPDRPLGI